MDKGMENPSPFTSEPLLPEKDPDNIRETAESVSTESVTKAVMGVSLDDDSLADVAVDTSGDVVSDVISEQVANTVSDSVFDKIIDGILDAL